MKPFKHGEPLKISTKSRVMMICVCNKSVTRGCMLSSVSKTYCPVLHKCKYIITAYLLLLFAPWPFSLYCSLNMLLLFVSRLSLLTVWSNYGCASWPSVCPNFSHKSKLASISLLLVKAGDIIAAHLTLTSAVCLQMYHIWCGNGA